MAAAEADVVDLLIRGGLLVDGTGASPRVADVAVRGRAVAAVGPDLPLRGRREVDARGLVVAPGWVDPHTHYDGQVTWDPYLTPSTAAGVTTLIMGNCGVGFAPCPEGLRDFLVDLMDAVEDVPGSALNEGIQWEWETFPEYMAAIDRKALACDVGVLVGHAGVRTWVLGHRASLSDRPGGPASDPVQPEEIALMAKVVEEAVAAGAMGFSTSRLLVHRDNSGTLMPGTLAASDEMRAMGDAIARGGGGCLELASDFSTYDDVAQKDPRNAQEYFASEWRWIEEVVTKHPGKVGISMGIGAMTEGDPEVNNGFWRFALGRLGRLADQGARVSSQVMTRLGGLHFSLDAGYHPLQLSQTFRALEKEARGAGQELLARLALPEQRAAIIKEALEAYRAKDRHPAVRTFVAPFGEPRHLWPWSETYEPPLGGSIQGLADQEGKTAVECMYDVLAHPERPHGGVLWRPLYNYAAHNLEVVRELLSSDLVTPGFADAGAHVRFVCDATTATHLLTHWVRDRSRGPRLPLEVAVRKHTADTAAIFGLHDRGVLRPGLKADLNVIDLGALRLRPPTWATDLPLGAGRWVQAVEGYRLTVVSGEVTHEDGAPTGRLPGRLVRNPARVGLPDGLGLRGSVPACAGGGPERAVDLQDHALELATAGDTVAGLSSAGRVAKRTDAAAQSKL